MNPWAVPTGKSKFNENYILYFRALWKRSTPCKLKNEDDGKIISGDALASHNAGIVKAAGPAENLRKYKLLRQRIRLIGIFYAVFWMCFRPIVMFLHVLIHKKVHLLIQIIQKFMKDNHLYFNSKLIRRLMDHLKSAEIPSTIINDSFNDHT